MKNNKVYLPTDAIARHEDFDVWYADGETFLSIKGAWSKESDKAVIFGRMGGEMGDQARPQGPHLLPEARTLGIRVTRSTCSSTTT